MENSVLERSLVGITMVKFFSISLDVPFGDLKSFAFRHEGKKCLCWSHAKILHWSSCKSDLKIHIQQIAMEHDMNWRLLVEK